MEKLKKLLTKFRRWLILKLEGYLDPGPVIQAISRKDVSIEKFIAVSSLDFSYSNRLEQHCKDDAMQQMLKAINQSGFVRWDTQYHAFRQVMSVRATIFVVNPNHLDTWNDDFY